MPLYEFRCPACGIFDEWRSIADRSQPAICPSCQKSANRIMSIPGIQLNGSIRLKRSETPQTSKSWRATVDDKSLIQREFGLMKIDLLRFRTALNYKYILRIGFANGLFAQVLCSRSVSKRRELPN
jgi:putative FmdB family regulatory protein